MSEQQQLGEVRTALVLLGGLNRPPVWVGVAAELDELRRGELGAVLADAEAALSVIAELVEHAGTSAREYLGAPLTELDETTGLLCSAHDALAGAVDELGAAVALSEAGAR